MANRYIAFDIETPNYANNRISAIGITVVEDGEIAREFYTLVNPETHFDAFNIRLTGITPEQVEDKPNFKALWQTIEPIMSSGLLIAHNAPFDMHVLGACLDAYETDWRPYADYACTCAMGRACYPELKSHKLNALCDHLGFSLNHHHAGSDSLACAKLLLDYINQGICIARFQCRYDFTSMRGQRISSNPGSGLRTYNRRRPAARCAPDSQTVACLHRSFQESGDTQGDAGVCGCEDMTLSGKTFCLTGEFAFGDRSKVQQALFEKGGIPVSTVNRKTDYLIVGSKGSSAWVTESYGTKMLKALELREQGAAIRIVAEEQMVSLLLARK